jgi:hypothetical protein
MCKFTYGKSIRRAYPSLVPAECAHRTLRIAQPGVNAATAAYVDGQVHVFCADCRQTLELHLTQSELQLLARLAAPRGSTAAEIGPVPART